MSIAVSPVPSRQAAAYGQSFASFGEIVQGRCSSGEDFLVTLPINLWSNCELRYQLIDGASRVDAPLPKAKQVAELMLQSLGMTRGFYIQLDIQSEVPIGKGLSSSTADMLAVVRAFQQAFDTSFDAVLISQLFACIEPHDALHYEQSVIYNHRQGKLLQVLNYTPNFHLIAVDAGGELSTLDYNHDLRFSTDLLQAYDQLYQSLQVAFAKQDDQAIAHCARRSTELHVARTGNVLLTELLQQAPLLDVQGVISTHSGTCGALLLPPYCSAQRRQQVKAALGHLGRVFCLETLAS